jgi:hypothetical protein
VRLRSQAAAEAAFFAGHMPEEVEAGRATCGALIAGVSRVFLEHLKTEWAPATMRRLDAAIEQARRDDAALGLPELAGRTPDEVAQAQILAAAAAARLMTGGSATVERECCQLVLEPLRRRVVEMLGGRLERLSAMEAVKRLEGDAVEVTAECRRAAREWSERWVSRLLGLLETNRVRVTSTFHSIIQEWKIRKMSCDIYDIFDKCGIFGSERNMGPCRVLLLMGPVLFL